MIEPVNCKECGAVAAHECTGWLWDHCHWVACTNCDNSSPAVDDSDYDTTKTDAQLRSYAIRIWNADNKT